MGGSKAFLPYQDQDCVTRLVTSSTTGGLFGAFVGSAKHAFEHRPTMVRQNTLVDVMKLPKQYAIVFAVASGAFAATEVRGEEAGVCGEKERAKKGK